MKKVFIACICCLTVITACRQKTQTQMATQTVKVDTVRLYGMKEHISFPGKVKAAADVNLAFRTSGPISKIWVEPGQYVQKGQVLAEMDARDYQIQFAATEAEYNQIKAEAERIISLHNTGSVTDNDYDKAVYGLKQITAKYNAHKNALADTELKAPFTGYIQQRFFNTGETIGAGTPVLSMISAGLPEVEINIPSADFIRRDRFEAFSCAVDIYPETTYPLDLIGVAQKANLNQLYTMRLRISNATGHLPSPGMSTIVTISLKPENGNMVSIPLSAVIADRQQSSVWVYDPQTQLVKRRSVHIHSITTDGLAIVSSGLAANEIIVSAGVHQLKENEAVQPLPAVAPTNVGGLL